MIKLNDKQINFIRLIRRSENQGDGWRLISQTLRRVVTDTVAEQPELYETKEHEGGLMLRLSERGLVLGDYV